VARRPDRLAGGKAEQEIRVVAERSRIEHRIQIAAGLILVFGTVSAPARAQSLASVKIDPALRAAAAAAPTEPLPVWVSFVDKGLDGPGDLALALAAARERLSPRCLARRIRTGVEPLVDERDLSLYPPYLDALRAHGLIPYATSRWLNQVAVRLAPDRLAEAANLPFVSGLRLVERGSRTPEPAPSGAELPAKPRCENCAVQAHAFDYGRNATEVQQLHIPEVHDAGYTGAGVVIAMLDDGFNYHNDQEALATIDIPPGFERDFVDGDWSVQDTVTFSCCGHGTLVLGCVAGNKSGSYVGTAPGATYALARTEVDATETPVEMAYWAMAAEWADSLGADIISSSLGYSTFDGGVGNYTYADMNGHTTTITRAAEIAASKGMLVVVAAGNEGNSSWRKILAPADANGDSVLGIGAVSASDVRPSFSSMGPTSDGRIKPDVVAMGVNNIVTSGPGAGYVTESGTSLSTPLIAGLAACLMQARPSLTPTLIIRSIRETSSRTGPPDTLTGYGLPNAVYALQWQSPDLGVGAPPATTLAIQLAGPNPHSSCDAPVRVTFGLGTDAPPSAQARVSIYDLSGRRVRNLYDGVLTRGTWHAANWDGRDESGRAAAAGMYFIGFEALGRRSTVRLVSLR
jgi:serine protease AprX